MSTWRPESLPGETPSATADRILAFARKLIAWAREYEAPPADLCVCGKQIHQSHLAAAQHAVWLMICGDDREPAGRQPGQWPTLKIRVYQCRQNYRALHVGH